MCHLNFEAVCELINPDLHISRPSRTAVECVNFDICILVLGMCTFSRLICLVLFMNVSLFVDFRCGRLSRGPDTEYDFVIGDHVFRKRIEWIASRRIRKGNNSTHTHSHRHLPATTDIARSTRRCVHDEHPILCQVGRPRGINGNIIRQHIHACNNSPAELMKGWAVRV